MSIKRVSVSIFCALISSVAHAGANVRLTCHDQDRKVPAFSVYHSTTNNNYIAGKRGTVQYKTKRKMLVTVNQGKFSARFEVSRKTGAFLYGYSTDGRGSNTRQWAYVYGTCYRYRASSIESGD